MCFLLNLLFPFNIICCIYIDVTVYSLLLIGYFRDFVCLNLVISIWMEYFIKTTIQNLVVNKGFKLNVFSHLYKYFCNFYIKCAPKTFSCLRGKFGEEYSYLCYYSIWEILNFSEQDNYRNIFVLCNVCYTYIQDSKLQASLPSIILNCTQWTTNRNK